jgi:GTPase SAR1 family protein
MQVTVIFEKHPWHRDAATSSLESPEMKLKFVVAGPKGAGKTLISNCLVGQSDRLTTESYSPTVGVRILEHELRLSGINEDINVELWDASGDQKYGARYV